MKTALVTGSSRGLGRAIAGELARRGYQVAVHSRSAESAQAVVAAIRQDGGTAEAFAADIGQAAACQELVTAVAQRLGSLDVLVNNAGITKDTLAIRMKDSDWTSVIDTDLSSAFYLSRTALRGMLSRKWGRIVNVSSVVGLVGNVGQANYVAAKAGLIGLTKALAQEYASKGITVNAVAPGFITSDMTAGLTAELKAAYLARTPAGRFGTPEEVAHAVAFFVSDEAAYINGQTLIVAGGMVMA
jgi:3-oxoacyl-[acyl-carrier protein] reductase